MKCTIQNIADHLGLSRNTVSKALKNSSEVSENTRNLVIKTASKLNLFISRKEIREYIQQCI